jgi:hypothetical protein
MCSRFAPISHPIRAWVPLRKAQRIEEVTYDPLLYFRYEVALGIIDPTSNGSL